VSAVTDIWRAVATLDDLWEGEMKAVEVDGIAVVLINIDGEVYAYEDQCPHLGSRLSEGSLDRATLTCSAHEWVFDCRLGLGINPTSASLRQFAVRTEGDVIALRMGGNT
jgi:toluene monooxygenase system ferredoxin subunit